MPNVKNVELFKHVYAGNHIPDAVYLNIKWNKMPAYKLI